MASKRPSSISGGVFALCFLPGPPHRCFSSLPLGFDGFSAAGVVCDDLVGIDASTALLSHVRRTASGCRQTYSTVDILVARADGAEVPTSLQSSMAHPSPNGPSAIECSGEGPAPAHRRLHIGRRWKRRDLTDEMKRTLRKTELCEAIDLHRRGLVTHAIMARYFGLKTKQLRHWCNQFERTDKISLVGNRTGMMTEEWRNKVVTLGGDRPITETHGEFHAYLVKEHDFPWKKGTLSTYLQSIGYRSENRYRKVEIAFGDLIECEYSKLPGPPRLSSFHRLLQSKGFSFGGGPLRNYMEAHGLKYEPKSYARDWQQRVVAVAQAMRPKSYRTLHAFVKKKHKYPLSINAMTRSLRAAGIELSTRAQGGRRFGPDSARAACRHGPGATAAKP
jgi:hypothetical protein